MRARGPLSHPFAVALLIVSSLVVSSSAQSMQPAAPAAGFDLSTIRIDNFGQVNSNYYRGAQPLGRDYVDLAALGVKTVVDLQQDGDLRESSFVEAAGMKFFRIPMTTHEPPTAEKLARFLQLVNDPANQPVFVHCAGGRHRTGVMTAVYRMTGDGWTPDQAFKEMKRYNFGPDFLHPEFKKFVYAYQPEVRPTTPVIVPVVAPAGASAVVPAGASK